MHSPRRRSLRTRPAFRGAALLSAFALLAACGSNVAGSAVLPATAATAIPATPTTGGTAGQITEPSVLPGGSGRAATSSAPAPTSGTSSPAPAGSGAAGTASAGLGKFYSQKLAWGGCASYATSSDDATLYGSPQFECAHLTVPMAYADPTGPTVEIGVLRKVATDASARIGSLLINPGGPGVSGMSFVAQLAAYKVAPALNAKFDLVGFDPRGIGSAVPLVVCQSDAELDATRAQSERSNTQAAIDAANNMLKAYVAGCVTKTGAAGGVDGKTFLANVGTRDVARDMDVLRGVLGDSKLTYLGGSYGTRIGYVYAEEFPKNVRAMILDGAVDPLQTQASGNVKQEKGFQQAFVTFAAWCAQQGSCALGDDPQKATAVFQGLSRPVLAKPLPLSDGRVLSYGDATLGVSEALYDNTSWPDLSKALTGLAAAKGAGLMALADQYYGRSTSGKYARKPDSFNAVRCVDDPPVTTPSEVIKINAEFAAVAPFEDSGDPPADIPDLCADWPVPPTLAPHQLKAPGLPKVLVISTTGDPATPYQNGVDLAQQLGATLLTYQGTRHAAFLVANSACVNDVGNTYLLTLQLPAAGTRCG